ncbi:MAG: translational activator for mitochondrial COX1 [Alyxoria varia]|nr:MAG: translational activator for mitochondrial COX1 [Alyxoria varia]
MSCTKPPSVDNRMRYVSIDDQPGANEIASFPIQQEQAHVQQQQQDDPSHYVTSLGQSSSDKSRALLREGNLFHPYSNSPSPELRRRYAFMRSHAHCPHPDHLATRTAYSPYDPETRKPLPDSEATSEDPDVLPPAHVSFECPDCGTPIACCEDHWATDFENHLDFCETLKQINEDDHDLHSGRFFPEFEYPGHQRADEFMVNMSNWDAFLYTRDFRALDEPRRLRQVTRLLTYPITIASVISQLSPYNIKKDGRLTPEGLRSFSALRYTLHPPRTGADASIRGIRASPPPIRIFVLGARGESSLPREIWLQLTYCFPRSKFHLIFIGPESMAGRDREFPLPEATPHNPHRAVVEDRLGGAMKISTYVAYFHDLYRQNEFGVFDPYFDFFVGFHPGFGHPSSEEEWSGTLPCLLETKCPVICTGYTLWDMERDRRWVVERTAPKGPGWSEDETGRAGEGEGHAAAADGASTKGTASEVADAKVAKKEKDMSPDELEALRVKREEGEMDILLEPGENIFRSMRWDLNELDPCDVSCGNWGIWAFRGKRYEATHQ